MSNKGRREAKNVKKRCVDNKPTTSQIKLDSLEIILLKNKILSLEKKLKSTQQKVRRQGKKLGSLKGVIAELKNIKDNLFYNF